MKAQNFLLACSFILSVSSASGQSLTEIDCRQTGLDSIDLQTVYRFINGRLDTLQKELKKSYQAFKPCQVKTYRAVYKNRKGELISEGFIKTLPTGEAWDVDPNMQNELYIQFELPDSATRARVEAHKINSSLEISWKALVTEGVIENEQQLWMHPFRSNQYYFTEIAPFPEVKLPLRVGEKWQSELQIGSGWGDWDNSLWKQRYKVKREEDLSVPFGKLEGCFRIEALSKNPVFGKSRLTCWYHKDYGFVKLVYVNPEKQTLDIRLEKIKQHKK